MQGSKRVREVQPVTLLLATVFTIVATVHGLLYLYWLQRIALPNTLSLTGSKSAEQIFNQNDPYYTVRKYLRQHVRNAKEAKEIVLVGETVEPPSRFDLEVYYELYPQLPLKLAAGSAELEKAVAEAESGMAFISVPELKLDPARFTTIIGEQHFIYVRK